jgi:outer membrane protein TolC
MLVLRKRVVLVILISTTILGCAYRRNTRFQAEDCSPPKLNESCGAKQLEISDPHPSCCPISSSVEWVAPHEIAITQLTPDRIVGLSLQEAIQYALTNSAVLRELGGTILRAPQAVFTRNDPAIVYNDPRFGEEAALAEFDATLNSALLFENNDRRLNNRFFGNQGFFQQDLHNYSLGLTKRSASGTLMTVRGLTTYDSNNQLSNDIGPSSWEQIAESEIRHPLMLGGGNQFNRIAGPGAKPGQINGILIARIRTDISLTDFEKSVRDFVADVENSYWDLYFAYRELEARVDARDIALSTARKLEGQSATQGSGDAAQAMEQYYRFESDVIDSVNGRPFDGTRTNNGSSGGTFRAGGGLRVCERRLRLMIGFPINDGRMIQPTDEPSVAPMIPDWQEACSTALLRREEIRRQRWIVKQRELELIANRQFLQPQLDVIARYRFRGFGNHWIDEPVNENAWRNMLGGDYQEWQAGLEYSLPVGLRRGYAAVKASQIALHREIQILQEQERNVVFGLSNSINETQRSFETLQLQERRLQEIVRQLQSLQAKSEAGQDPALDVLLETHRRLLDARIRYHQSRIEYSIAQRNFHFERGTLLDYCNVGLNEAISDAEAYEDAAVRIAGRGVIR